MANTAALSGGFMYRPTMSRTLATNCGSGESLNDSVRCGCRPNVLQIRPTIAGLTPTCAAILRVLQWVRPLGVVSSLDDDRLNLFVGDSPLRPDTRLIEQAIETLLDEPLAPLANHLVSP